MMLQNDLSQWSILSESKVDNGNLYANIHFLRKRVGGWGVMNGDTIKKYAVLATCGMQSLRILERV